ncbi:hypothetical protein F5Y01DRAFT_326708 [Xylaria sp. FL0043]|nr:hypothetical protein F5Y01DRAFT_326708 [Xylaria sp. FL0043]
MEHTDMNGELTSCDLHEDNMKFHLFPKLPAELRLAIWEYAIYEPPQLVQTIQCPCHVRLLVLHTRVPPLFLVNREAYHAVKSCYLRLNPDTGYTNPTVGPLITLSTDIVAWEKGELAPAASPWRWFQELCPPPSAGSIVLVPKREYLNRGSQLIVDIPIGPIHYSETRR